MICIDTLRSTEGGGSGKLISEDDKDVAERMARALGTALDAAVRTRKRFQTEVGDLDELEVREEKKYR
jgi:hypothetical protein